MDKKTKTKKTTTGNLHKPLVMGSWVATSVRLPKIKEGNMFGSDWVLVVNEYKEMEVAIYHYGKNEWVTEEAFGEPLYWMQLPEPPNFS